MLEIDGDEVEIKRFYEINDNLYVIAGDRLFALNEKGDEFIEVGLGTDYFDCYFKSTNPLNSQAQKIKFKYRIPPPIG